ncbi:hypothetical protein [Nostoc sp. CCY0012]|uniref:hypothetical protein n=1 Tax=Nostoc sp. CCY0012 TaxID=1056123 RepID=UPI0039C6DA12
MVCISKAIVYVWKHNVLNFDLGHASLSIRGADGSSSYLSFWPNTSRKKDLQHLWKSSDPYIPKNYPEDCTKITRPADEIINIPNLLNPNKYSIDSYTTAWEKQKWDITSSNCCYTVIDNLKDMSGISPPQPQSWHGIYTPKDVIKYAEMIRLHALKRDLGIHGNVSYEIIDPHVEITVDKLINNRNSGTSKTLRLIFWATESPFDGKEIDKGHIFAETRFDPLKGGWNYYDIKHTVTYCRPPRGKYYVLVTLNEDNENGKWPIYDWVYFDNKLYCD